jgi:phosphoglycolate phosphatase
MPFRAILFDLDGTLLDTLTDIGDSVNRVLTRQGFGIHPMQAYRQFIGDGFSMLLRRALPQDQRSTQTIQTCVDAFKADYSANWHNKTRLYPGIGAMLDALARRDLKLAILSNKAHAFTQKCVARYLSNWNFEAVFGGRDNVPPKPDPAGALEVSRLLDVRPPEFLYLGDSGVDMQTAIAAKMFPVGVSWGFRSTRELQQNGCQALIDRPLEVLDLLT